jgi:hypothetical protein
MSRPYLSQREAKEGVKQPQLLALRGIEGKMPSLRALSFSQFSLDEDSFDENSISAPNLKALKLTSCYSV